VRFAVRGGAGVARLARSSRIWARIIPQDEEACSRTIVGLAGFSESFEGRREMDAITRAPTTKLYGAVRFCYPASR